MPLLCYRSKIHLVFGILWWGLFSFVFFMLMRLIPLLLVASTSHTQPLGPSLYSQPAVFFSMPSLVASIRVMDQAGSPGMHMTSLFSCFGQSFSSFASLLSLSCVLP